MKLTITQTTYETVKHETREMTDQEFNETWPPNDESITRQLYDQLVAAERERDEERARVKELEDWLRRIRDDYRRLEEKNVRLKDLLMEDVFNGPDAPAPIGKDGE
jgi:hypothetical protein